MLHYFYTPERHFVVDVSAVTIPSCLSHDIYVYIIWRRYHAQACEQRLVVEHTHVHLKFKRVKKTEKKHRIALNVRLNIRLYKNQKIKKQNNLKKNNYLELNKSRKFN